MEDDGAQACCSLNSHRASHRTVDRRASLVSEVMILRDVIPQGGTSQKFSYLGSACDEKLDTIGSTVL